MRARGLAVRVCGLAVAWLVGVGSLVADEVTLGIAPSLMRDLTPGQQKLVRGEFPILIKDFTRLDGKIVEPATDADLLRQTLSGTTQFVILQGIEYAWARAEHPELTPLLVAIYRAPRLRAVLVGKKDGPGRLAELKGKDVTWLKQGKEHIRVFVRKATDLAPEKFFGKILTPENPEAALDDVLLGKVHAAAVEQDSLDIYRDVNPGRFKRLQVIESSPEFPPTVIAYVPARVSSKVAGQFRDGLFKANQSVRGRDLMSTFKMTAFTPVPAELESWATAIRTAYPTRIP